MKYHIILFTSILASIFPLHYTFGQNLRLNQNVEYAQKDFDSSLSVLKLDVSSTLTFEVKELRIEDLSGKKLWGEFSWQDSTVRVKNPAVDANTLFMSLPHSCTIGFEETSFRFPVPEGTLCGGFTVKLYDLDGNLKAVATHTSALKMNPGKETCVKLKVNEVCNETADLKRRGFYKSLFVDGGYTLNHICKKEQLPAISLLSIGDDYEYYGGKDTLVQYRIMVRNHKTENEGWEDRNGVLLYPDGSPRFRAIYVNGGNSIKHGRSLTVQGRQQINSFFCNGGSYIGTCAGSILPTTFVKSSAGVKNYYEGEKGYTFGLFPGAVERGGLPQKNVK